MAEAILLVRVVLDGDVVAGDLGDRAVALGEDHVTRVACGAAFDAGDRKLAAIRPPVFDSPTTRGLYDPSSGQVVLSTTRLASLGPVDAAEGAVSVGAGATLGAVTTAALTVLTISSGQLARTFLRPRRTLAEGGRMIAGQPSQTMLQTALLRAAHQLLDEPRIFDDPIAVDLVPDPEQAIGRLAFSEPTLRHVSLPCCLHLRASPRGPLALLPRPEPTKSAC